MLFYVCAEFFFFLLRAGCIDAEQEGENFTVEVLDVLPELQIKPDRHGDDRRYVWYCALFCFLRGWEFVFLVAR